MRGLIILHFAGRKLRIIIGGGHCRQRIVIYFTFNVMDMKKRYEIGNDEVIYAADAHEFVTALREGSYFDSYGTNAQYMKRFAGRSVIYNGSRPRTSSEEAFLEDLIRSGFAKEA